MFEFRKYHGLGNDFIVAEGTASTLSTEQIIALCRRHRGVGADGVILAEQMPGESVPRISMVIFNRDGSRPEMCGNGVRCVAAFARWRWGIGDEMVVKSDAGPRRCVIVDGGEKRWSVAVDMGVAAAQQVEGTLDVAGRCFKYISVDVGNPHAVIFADASIELVEEVGVYANDGHPAFPDGVNVEFAVANDGGRHYETVVYERGVGLTQACGTGACAVAEAAWTTGRAGRDCELVVELPGGALTIDSREDRLWMTGPAVEVFSGGWNWH